MRPFVLPHLGWLFDLDGTVYLGETLIPGAAEAIAALRGAGRRVAFLSNKPLYSRADYARTLTRLGVEVVVGSEVLGSATGKAKKEAEQEAARLALFQVESRK